MVIGSTRKLTEEILARTNDVHVYHETTTNYFNLMFHETQVKFLAATRAAIITLQSQ